MIANMERTPPPEVLARIGKPVERKPEEIRSLILNAIGAGFNTIRSLKEETKLDHGVIIREIEILQGLFITVIPEPVESFWLKGKVPEKVYIENGKAIAIREKKKKSEKVSSEVFQKKAAEIAEINKPKIEAKQNLQIDAAPGIDEFRTDMLIDLLVEHSENPRGFVDDEEPAFIDLRDSIASVGVQEPLIVTPIPKSASFRIVIGHRRCKAARAAGLRTVPCIVRRFSSIDEEENVMLIENIQRKNLSPIQEARAFKKALDKEKSIHAVARKLGLTQSYLTNRMQLLNLDPAIQVMLDRGEVNMTVGQILSSLPPKKQRKLLPRALTMKTADLSEVVRKYKSMPDGEKIPVVKNRKPQKARVTSDDEKFTRTGALKALSAMGDSAWITVKYLKDSFDDICTDSCLESRDESICHGCPMPRFVASVTRRAERSES